VKIGAITIILSVMSNISSTKDIVSQNITGVSLIETSQQLLLRAKTHESTESLEEVIKNISGKTLRQQLKDDNHKKAVLDKYIQCVYANRSFKKP
jgi:predicted ATP-dependent serine protease